MKLTFKQYLEGKEQLRAATANTPTTIVEYEVRKYCSLCIGESKDESKIVGLKPKQKLIVQWRYDNMDNPTPEYIQFIGDTLLEDGEHPLFWTGQKLHKWLMRHTREEKTHGYKIEH
jgi:hypothetical protein